MNAYDSEQSCLLSDNLSNCFLPVTMSHALLSGSVSQLPEDAVAEITVTIALYCNFRTSLNAFITQKSSITVSLKHHNSQPKKLLQQLSDNLSFTNLSELFKQ
jgi:hypothetical protein